MITFQIEEQFQDKIKTQRLEEAVLSVLKHQDADPDSGVSILIGDDEKIQELNKEYLDIISVLQ